MYQLIPVLINMCIKIDCVLLQLKRLLGVPEGLIDWIILHVSGVNKVTVRAVP